MPKPIVFYDGGCPLCRREINHYRRLDRFHRIDWKDIDSDPEPLKQYGISYDEAMRELHVIDQHQHIQQGFNSFITIWQTLPPYHLLAMGINHFKLGKPLGLFYTAFAKWRYRSRCNGSCTIISNKK